MHVFGARVGGIDACGIRAGVPVVDRRVVLHTRVTAEVRALADHTHEIARLECLANLAAPDIFGLPLAIFFHGAHEFVRDPNGIVGVLKKHAAVRRAIKTRIIAGFD